jgi:uncharacterized protein (DUF885 family)
MRVFLIVLVIAFSCSRASAQPPARDIINKVITDIEDFGKKEFPPDTITATPFGSFTGADLQRRYRFYKQQYDTLQPIDAATLELNYRIDLELLRYRLRDELNYFEFREYMNPVLSDEGFHTNLPREAGRQYLTVKDFRQYLNKLHAFPAYAAQQMEWIRKGLALGISQPKVALTGYEATYNTHITDTVERSVFFSPFKTRPAAIGQEDWNALVSEGKSIITTDVINTYKKIKFFFETEYYPKARKSLGASQLPDGKAYYAALVKHHTTTDITPEEVFDLGMSEVSRIKKEMEAVIKEVGFQGSFKEFFTYLRTDPKFFVTTPEQLLKEASFIAKKIDGKLPLLFGKLPRQPYGVEPVPAYLAPSYTTGRYSPGGGKKTAGMYWVNTYDLKSRTLYTLEALTLHEAVPGHHLQIALTRELTQLPKFRQSFYVNAFGEGWGLYSEYLGYELGLYKDPYSRFGRLTYEMWRACRLVIDAGIHSKGWSREQAVDFLASNSALSLHEVNTEVNRYISWPGQALAYKIGELKIKSLRNKAEQALKDKFDVRAFHDLLLSQGSVTLSILEMMVDDYIRKELAK